jgi:FtsH-binding integral membrane protein
MTRMVEADPSSTDGPDATGEPRSRPRLTGLRIQPPYRNAAVVMAIAVTMVSIFAVSYTLALGRPTPHDIPAAVVGHLARQPGVIAALEAATGNSVRLTSYASLTRAEHAISEQRIYAALALTAGRPRLLVASAAGISVARVLVQGAQAVPARAGGPVQIVDLHPLPPTDPQGLASFYATLAATILGFVTMFQLRANAESLSLRAWLVCIVVLALVGGLVLALITDPLLQALRGPFPELWAALAAEVAAAALFNSAMLTLIGRWAIIPTWGLFIAIGNAASGGAVAPPLLPAFYRFVGRFLPNGATVETIRNAVYFTDHQHLEPILVEAAWITSALVLLLIAAERRGRTPGTG